MSAGTKTDSWTENVHLLATKSPDMTHAVDIFIFLDRKVPRGNFKAHDRNILLCAESVIEAWTPKKQNYLREARLEDGRGRARKNSRVGVREHDKDVPDPEVDLLATKRDNWLNYHTIKAEQCSHFSNNNLVHV